MSIETRSDQSPSIFPLEIDYLILSYLPAQALGRMARVCKQWKTLTDRDDLWDFRKFFPLIKVVDQQEWKTYFNVEKTSLDLNDIEPLNSKKTIKQLAPIINKLTADTVKLKESLTWTLLLRPQGHNAEILKKIIESPKQGNSALFGEIGCFPGDGIAEPFYNIAVDKTHRVFISTLLIQSTRSTLDEKEALVKQIRGCQIPDALTIATYQMFSHVIEGPDSDPTRSSIAICSKSCTAFDHPLVVQRTDSCFLSVFATHPGSRAGNIGAIAEQSIP